MIVPATIAIALRGVRDGRRPITRARIIPRASSIRGRIGRREAATAGPCLTPGLDSRRCKMITNSHFQQSERGTRLGPDGSRAARQPCRGPSHADPALAGFPLHHRGRRRAGRAADADRLVALLHPFPRAPQPSRRRGLVAVLGGDRHLGPQRARRLGVGHHELRVLGRDRARRDAHLGDPLPLPPDMAHLDQPLGGGDDHLRGHVRPDVPGDPRGTRLGRLLDVPAPEPDGHVAQLQEPAPLGRLRGQHLRNRLVPVLVRRPDPGPGDDSRSGENPHPAGSSTVSSPSDGGAPCGNGITTKPPTSFSPPSRRRWSSRFIRSSRWISRSRSSLDGIRRSSRPTSSRARSSPGSPWC